MKRFALILLRWVSLLFISVTVSQCDLNNDTSFHDSWPVNFSVNLSSSNPDSLLYSVYSEYDANYNPYIVRYRSKVKKIDLENITYEITYYSGPAGIPFTNGTLTLTSSGKTVVSQELVKFQRITDNIEMTNINSEGFMDINQKLNSNRLIGVTAQGKVSSSNIRFSMIVHFHVIITLDSL